MPDNPHPSYHNNRWYNKHPEVQRSKAVSVLPKAATAKQEPYGFSFGDSIGLGAIILAAVSYVLTPPLYVRILMLSGSGILCFFFFQKSHWTYCWTKWIKYAAAALVVGGLFAIGIPQFISQWREGHPRPDPADKNATKTATVHLTDKSQSQDTSAPVPTPKAEGVPGMPKPQTKKRLSISKPQSAQASDSVACPPGTAICIKNKGGGHVDNNEFHIRGNPTRVRGVESDGSGTANGNKVDFQEQQPLPLSAPKEPE